MKEARAEKPKRYDSDPVVEELRVCNRLLAVMATRGMDQKLAIALLDGVGFQPRQIAIALGVTSNAVSITLHRLRKTQVPTEAEIAGGK